MKDYVGLLLSLYVETMHLTLVGALYACALGYGAVPFAAGPGGTSPLSGSIARRSRRAASSNYDSTFSRD
jgi:hypothetical protein